MEAVVEEKITVKADQKAAGEVQAVASEVTAIPAITLEGAGEEGKVTIEIAAFEAPESSDNIGTPDSAIDQQDDSGTQGSSGSSGSPGSSSGTREGEYTEYGDFSGTGSPGSSSSQHYVVADDPPLEEAAAVGIGSAETSTGQTLEVSAA